MSANEFHVQLIGLFGILSAISTISLLLYFLVRAQKSSIDSRLMDFSQYCYLFARFHRSRPSSLASEPTSKRSYMHLATCHGISNFVQSTLGRYLIYLITSDLLQGLPFCINLRWASTGLIQEGVPCTAQGMLRTAWRIMLLMIYP